MQQQQAGTAVAQTLPELTIAQVAVPELAVALNFRGNYAVNRAASAWGINK